jgi:hypothetical protein
VTFLKEGTELIDVNTSKGEENRILEDFKDRELEDLKWPAYVNMVTKLWVPQKAGNFFNTCVTMTFSSDNLLHGFIY